MLSISNFLTCLLAGFVVFTYMGALSKQTNLGIENVIQGGQGLVYIVYPYAATTLSGGPIWAFMFFLMMVTLGNARHNEGFPYECFP
jgi:SNF family Na+-dependent transporter